MRRTVFRFFQHMSNRLTVLLRRPAPGSENLRCTEAMPGDEITEVVVRAFSRGSEPAFKVIYDRFAPAIYRVVQRYLQSPVLAEELVEELFSNLWRDRALYADVAHLRISLFTSARNLAIKYLEKVTIEMLSASPGQENDSNEISSIAATAGSPVNMLQHPSKGTRQPPA